MVEEQTILTSERLRDGLNELRRELRGRYSSASRQVTAENVRAFATRLAETWLVEIATDQQVASAVGTPALADLNVHFQRLLTCAEHATKRSRYDTELRAIIDNYTVNVLLPLKRSRGKQNRAPVPEEPVRGAVRSAFVGQSFDPKDEQVNQCVYQALDAMGVIVVTGERPKADSISEKVKRSIENQTIFVGVFTRRDKLARKAEWTTSSWVIDEKAYAVGRKMPLILLKEEGVGSIGGIQGDYQYLEFSRDRLELLVIRLMQYFILANDGLQK